MSDSDDTSLLYEDETVLLDSRGAGEEVYPDYEDYSYIDVNLPTDHGDNNDAVDNEMDDDNFYNLDGSDSIHEEDLQEDNWLSDSSEDDYDTIDNNLGDYSQIVLSSDEEEDDYVPICQFLSTDDLKREKWFDDPRGEDFRNAFSCLKAKKFLAKKYLLDILDPNDSNDDSVVSLVDRDPIVRDEITYALSELYLPGLARLSVEKLCDILIKYPKVDLRGYLVDLDVFTIAYIIFGIDFYMNRRRGVYRAYERTHSKYEQNEEERSPPSESVFGYWKESLDWLLKSLSSQIFSLGQSPPVYQ